MRLRKQLINEIMRLCPNYPNLEYYTYTQLKIIKICLKYNIPIECHEAVIRLKNEMLFDELGIVIENFEDLKK